MRLLTSWYTAIWPNLAASVIWTIPALAWHHRRLRRHIDRRVTPPASTTTVPPQNRKESRP